MQPLLKNTLKCRTRPGADETTLHILLSAQIHPNTGAYIDFCCIQIKQECGLHLGLSQALQLNSHWLVLGNKSVIGQFKDGVVGVRQRPGSKEAGQEAFHSSMVTIRVNTFRHLCWSRSRPGKGKQEVIHETTAFRAHVKNSFNNLFGDLQKEVVVLIRFTHFSSESESDEPLCKHLSAIFAFAATKDNYFQKSDT